MYSLVSCLLLNIVVSYVEYFLWLRYWLLLVFWKSLFHHKVAAVNEQIINKQHKKDKNEIAG